MRSLDENIVIKLEKMLNRYIEIGDMLSFEEVIVDNKLTIRLSKEQKHLEKVVELYKKYKKLTEDLEYFKTNLDSFSAQEKEQVQKEIEFLEGEISDCVLLVTDELANTTKEINKIGVQIICINTNEKIVSFANDLIGSYVNCCEIEGFDVSFVEDKKLFDNTNNSVTLEINGINATKLFENENGLHEFVEDIKGTILVVVFEMPNYKNYTLTDKDLKIDIFRSSGAGGQNVNKLSTAIRITHLQTGIVVTCQDERSQLQNKTKAMETIKQRVEDFSKSEFEKLVKIQKENMKSKSNKKVRTYNYLKNVVVDTLTGESMDLIEFKNGNLKPLFNKRLILEGN